MTRDTAAATGVSRLRARVAPLANHRWVQFLLSAGTLYGQRRVFGLAGEAAFWGVFTLPWVALGTMSAIATIGQWFGGDLTTQLRETILRTSQRVLTEDTVQQLTPLVDSVLAGSTGLTIVGFVVALWSGSRVFVTFVQGSQVLNGRPPESWVQTRALALLIYALGLVCVALVVFTVLLFPEAWSALVGIGPGDDDIVLVILGLPTMVAGLTTMLYLADPYRTGWRYELPGGAVAVLGWLLGSWGLSLYFQWLFRAGSVYGAIGAPIAVMLWVFVTVLAVFLGMTLTASMRLARHGRYLVPSDPAPYVDESLLKSGRED